MNKQELIETLEEIRANIDRDIEIGDRTVFSRGEKNAYNNAIGLAKQLDEPEKVVIPQVVADWIKYAKRQGYGFMQSYDPIYMSYPINDGLDKWIDDNEETFAHAWLDGYEVEKEQLYWAVRGVTDYFRCDEKIIVFKKEEEALEVANLIGINTEVKKMNSIDCSECISIEELRNENEEPLFYVALPKIGDTEFCYLWTDTDGAVYTQGNKGLCIGRLKHTEQEIKSIDERYWPFAMKVDGE
ncbi:DUF1642 domain-containing protein [Enterococcus faecalis]|nr:DUF1642 domain-containing protein [Enterococcus faecalis]